LKNWTFVTNHGAVLACIARRSRIRAIDIALELGLTERSVRRTIADLTAEGYIEKTMEGRINRYSINTKLPLRRPVDKVYLVNTFETSEGRNYLTPGLRFWVSCHFC